MRHYFAGPKEIRLALSSSTVYSLRESNQIPSTMTTMFLTIIDDE